MIGFIRRKIGFLRRMYAYAKQGPECRVVKVGLIHGRTLEGKTILVTGGGTGLGYEMAAKFVSEGAKVIITGRTESKLATAVEKIGGANIRFLVWDVSNVQESERMVDELFSSDIGGIDILVNNAGVSNRQRFGELSVETWDATYNTNLRGLVFLLQAVVNKWLLTKRGGVVLNVASFAAIEPNEDAYGSSKSALIGLTSGLGRKLARRNIRINAIAPGVIVGTNVNKVQRSVDPQGDVSCDWLGAGRYGIPSEISELATFLVGDAASYINGQTIVCDGGSV